MYIRYVYFIEIGHDSITVLLQQPAATFAPCTLQEKLIYKVMCTMGAFLVHVQQFHLYHVLYTLGISFFTIIRKGSGKGT